jgi:uncharacterized protein YkwD
MPAVRRADTGNVAPQRLVFVAVLSALCLCAWGSTSPTLAAPVARSDAHRKPVRRSTRAHHSAPCAKRSNFHSSGGHAHHKRRGASCKKRHSAPRHKTGTPRGTSHHSKARGRTHRPANQVGKGRHAPTGRAPAANGSPCSAADLRPTQNDLDQIRAATRCLVNRERVDHGESALAPNALLEQAAQRHTENMAFGDYFEHIGPRGDTPISRMRASGYIYSSQIGYEVGENIGFGTLSQSTPRAIVAAWMASPGHRANILDPHFRDTAIGVSPHPPSALAGRQAGAIYTQDFGVIITG